MISPLLLFRRPVAQRVRDIGIWLNIMESLGKISVVTNVRISVSLLPLWNKKNHVCTAFFSHIFFDRVL